MLVENDRYISIEALKKGHPVLPRGSKSRELKLLRFIDINTIDGGDEKFTIDSITSLFEIAVGSDCILCDPYDFFSKVLLGCDLESLWKNRQIKLGDISVNVSSKDRTFFGVRNGNLWGSIWVWSDDLSLSELEVKTKDILDSFREHGWATNRILPPPKMFERLLAEKTAFNDFPNISTGDIDEKVFLRAWNCFRGGRMESAKLGLCKNVFDYDYNSAYFSVLKDLPSLRFVKWIDTKEYIKDAYFGFCRCYIDIDDSAPVGPVAVRIDIKNKPARLFYPVCENISWRTKDDIDLINESGFGRVEILEGSWGILPNEYAKVFYHVSEILEKAIFDIRSRNLAKAMASVCWGKFASVQSSWFNPIYAAYITSKIRSKVTKMALLMEKDLIAITIDGLALGRELPDKNLISDEIGALKKRDIRNMISLSDVYRYNNDKPSTNWTPNNDGIFINELNIKVPFGSSKRRSPNNLSFDILSKEQFSLSPPTSEEAVMLYMETKAIVPWDVW